MRHQEALLRKKVGQYEYALQEMTLQYPPNNARRTYNSLEDKFILLTLNKYGLFADRLYEKLKQEIILSDLFTFDWFIRTRSVHELSKRSNTLLTLLVRENETPDSNKRKRNKVLTKEDTPGSHNNNGNLTPTPQIIQLDEHVDKKAKIEIA